MTATPADYADYTDAALMHEVQATSLLIAVVARIRDEAKAEGDPNYQNAERQLPGLDAKRTMLIHLLRERGALPTPPPVVIHATAATNQAKGRN